MPQSFAYAVPLKPGTYDQIHAHMDEIFAGATAKEGEEHAKEDLGLTTVKVWHQTEPIEALVFYFEGDDLEHALHPTRNEGHSVNQQWAEFFDQVTPHGPKSGRTSHELPGELLIDWHHEEGHRHDRRAARRQQAK